MFGAEPKHGSVVNRRIRVYVQVGWIWFSTLRALIGAVDEYNIAPVITQKQMVRVF